MHGSSTASSCRGRWLCVRRAVVTEGLLVLQFIFPPLTSSPFLGAGQTQEQSVPRPPDPVAPDADERNRGAGHPAFHDLFRQVTQEGHVVVSEWLLPVLELRDVPGQLLQATDRQIDLRVALHRERPGEHLVVFGPGSRLTSITADSSAQLIFAGSSSAKPKRHEDAQKRWTKQAGRLPRRPALAATLHPPRPTALRGRADDHANDSEDGFSHRGSLPSAPDADLRARSDARMSLLLLLCQEMCDWAKPQRSVGGAWSRCQMRRTRCRLRLRIASRWVLPSARLRAMKSRGFGVAAGASEGDAMDGVALSWRLPPRSRRWRLVLPELAGIGATPAARASLASEAKRPAPAISPINFAVVNGPKPGSASSCGAAWATRSATSASSAAAAAVSSRKRRSSSRAIRTRAVCSVLARRRAICAQRVFDARPEPVSLSSARDRAGARAGGC